MYADLDPLLHSQLRLAIMSILMNNDKAEFVTLKEQTRATAGNLSVQINKLATADYITIKKSFRDNKPLTICRISKKGIEAFEKYVEVLLSYIDVKR